MLNELSSLQPKSCQLHTTQAAHPPCSVTSPLTSFFNPNSYIGGIVYETAALSEKHKTLLTQSLTSESLAKNAPLSLFLGMKIEASIRVMVGPNSTEYQKFISIFAKINHFLNRTLPRQDGTSLRPLSQQEEQIIGSSGHLLKEWKSWKKTTEESAQLRLNKIDRANEKLKSLYTLIEDHSAQFHQYTTCFEEIFKDEAQRICFFDRLCHLCLGAKSPDTSQPYSKDFLQKYTQFSFLCFEYQLKMDPNQTQAIQQLAQTRNLFLNANTHEEYLEVLGQIQKTCAEYRRIHRREDDHLKNHLIQPHFKMNLELNRAVMRSFIQYFRSIEEVMTHYMQLNFPEEYPSDFDTLRLLLRLSDNLNRLASIARNQPLKFFGTRFTTQPERSITISSLSPQEQTISEQLTRLVGSYFDAQIQQLTENSSWSYWLVNMGDELIFPGLTTRPISFSRKGLENPVQAFRETFIPTLPQLKQELFSFLIKDVIPTLPRKKQTADELRKLMVSIPLSYFLYSFVMADGARLLNNPLSEEDPIHPHLSEIIFLEGIEELLPLPKQKNSQTQRLLEPAVAELTLSPSIRETAPASEPVVEPPQPMALPAEEDKAKKSVPSQNPIEHATSPTKAADEFVPYKGSVSSRKMQKFLEDNGFLFTSQRGSHMKFQHPSGHSEILPEGRDVLGAGLSQKIQRTVHEIVTKSQVKK